MKVREYTVQVWDRMGTEIMHNKTRDRVMMLQDLDRQTQRHDVDIASIKIEVKVVDNVEQQKST